VIIVSVVVENWEDAYATLEKLRVEVTFAALGYEREVHSRRRTVLMNNLGEQVHKVVLENARPDEEKDPATEHLPECSTEVRAGVDRLLILAMANHHFGKQRCAPRIVRNRLVGRQSRPTQKPLKGPKNLPLVRVETSKHFVAVT
jgi:hypothetical protein